MARTIMAPPGDTRDTLLIGGLEWRSLPAVSAVPGLPSAEQLPAAWPMACSPPKTPADAVRARRRFVYGLRGDSLSYRYRK
jgi:hypothetical protein